MAAGSPSADERVVVMVEKQQCHVGVQARPPPFASMCESLPAASADVLAQNRRVSTPFIIEKTQRDAGRAWDKFYKANEDRFFKIGTGRTANLRSCGRTITTC